MKKAVSFSCIVIITLEFLANLSVWAADGDEKWRVSTEGWVFSAPSIAPDGTIYFGSWDHHLYAINPDGSIIWDFEINGPIRCAAVIGLDGIIYITGRRTWAIYPNGTDYKWNFNVGYESPTIGAYGTLYSPDRHLYLLDISTGQDIGRFETEDDISTSASIGLDGNIYFGDLDGYIYSYTPTGDLNWRYRTRDMIQASPAINSDGTIYVASCDGYLYAFNPDGTVKWQSNINATNESLSYYITHTSAPAIGSDGSIYVGSLDNNLYAVNPDGSLKWTFLTQDDVYSSPAIGADGTIYVGSNDHYLYAVNADGSLKWAFETDDEVRSSPAVGMDGTVYVGSRDNNFYAIEDGSGGLADTPWPMYLNNLRRTGNAGDENSPPSNDNTDSDDNDGMTTGDNNQDNSGSAGEGSCFINSL
jgi:outer membrane protein assembly factor BamB